MGRKGMYMQGFVNVSFPLKGPALSWSSSGTFLECQDKDPILCLSRGGPGAGVIT